MNTRRIHYLFAGASFLVALIVYMATMQPSIPFWDCGEFAGAAWAMQVPHPPGSPLWTIIGRIGMLLPTYSDLVARYNFLSVLSSALTIMVLYLTVTRLITLWRGKVKNTADIITTYGSAFIAALTFTFTDSFWFNALECEVYAFGSLFIALIPWVMLVWYDHADEEHNEKYMLLAAYLIGLSMGVHQLALLTIFPSFMLIYYRRREQVTIGSWIGMAVSAVVAFLIAYKIVLSKLVEWMATMPIISIALIAGCIFGIWWSQKNHKALLNLSLWSAMLIFLGYSTYTMILVRANQNPPMNQNAPKTFAQFTRYINREQYGDRGQFPRRQQLEPGDENKPMFTNYSSDGDFFWRYQTDHMYNRYLYWNFIGRAGDKQDQGTDWSKTWGIPFILGLFGLYWHFRRDPKRALSMFAMFAMLGWMTAWYQNQQEPQPRERDYFYVGAFYVYAMWVGIGAAGLIEAARKKKSAEGETTTAENNDSMKPALIAAVVIIAVPINMCIGLAGMLSGKSFDESSKWAMYSRHNNYIPFDYAYNILQSCEKDAILFTYGDNDTFPLWCLQDVYGIRRDIRIVQLSLSNIGWYIEQLKNLDPWGAKRIKLATFSDRSLLVSETDPEAPKIKRATASTESVPVTESAVRWITGDSSRGAANLIWRYTGTYGDGKSQYLYTVADQLSLDIIRSNINERPIYYSVTVPDNNRIGLDRFLVAEGMALRVTPDMKDDDRTGYGGPVFAGRMQEYLLSYRTEASPTFQRGMLLRTYNDPTARMSYLDRQYAFNYYLAYMRYANAMLENGNNTEAVRALDTLDRRLPPELVRTDSYPADVIADLYDRAEQTDRARKYASIALEMLDRDRKNAADDRARMQLQYRHANLLMIAGKYDEALKEYQELKTAMRESGAGPITFRMLEIEAKKLEAAGKKAEALAKYEEMVTMVGVPEDQIPSDLKPIVDKRNKLRAELRK
jgi:tetratricopeptide (TPR) repeat protein